MNDTRPVLRSEVVVAETADQAVPVLVAVTSAATIGVEAAAVMVVAVEAEPGASGWRRLDPLSSRLDLVGPLATATGSLRGAAPSPLQLHVTTEGLGSASSSSRPPPPGAGGVGWARCPQLAAPSDGGLLPPLSPSPPPQVVHACSVGSGTAHVELRGPAT